MPAKRKRVNEEENSESQVGHLESRPKRRRNDTTLVDTIQYIFDALRNTKKDDDQYLCEAFLRVPRKKNEPQYYEVITSPIDMLKIQQKLKTDIYNELTEFYTDVQLLVENAKLYYAKSTEEHKDACELWEIFNMAKAKAPDEIQERQKQIQDDDDGVFIAKRKRGRTARAMLSSSTLVLEEDASPMSLEDAVEELFGALITASDPDGRIYCFDFIFLPSAENYPEYYEIIKNPLDLKIVAQRLQAKYYKNLEGMEKDLNLMFENACTFNEPGSQIYKDARNLIKMVEIRKQEIIQVLSQNGMRLRTKRPPGNRRWSEVLASMNEGDELPLSEDEQVELNVSVVPPEDDDSDDEQHPDSVFWQFFMAIKSLTLPSDPSYLLIEPFRKLPSRRFYSDYYQKIKNPIALSQIKNKLKKGEYHAMSEMIDDFNLMLDNAKRYNRQDSKLYKDANKLQKFIKTKTEDISKNEEVYESESESEDDGDGVPSSKRKSNSRPWTFKRRAKLLFKTLMDYMTDDGRQPIVAFIEKPARNEYPDYFEVIEDPIDMETIETKIKGEHYHNDDELIADFRLMFSNCQKYNEESSQIHQDSKILKKVLNEKVRELQMGSDGSSKGRSQQRKDKSTTISNLYKALKNLYSTIRDFTDNSNRQLSEVFLKLPSRTLYPDYYEVIKQPIDLEKISFKLKNISYVSMDDMLADLNLLFGNACRYNDPESQIYRDALSLHKLTLQTRLELCNQYDLYPNVQLIVQEMLISLFITVFNHEDSEGRYTAESFSELPEREEGVVVLSFDIMKRRLDCGHYNRMDNFQDDMFTIFGRARKHSKLNSKLYQDSVTLQRIYIKTRDEMCGNGTVLDSKAVHFKLNELNEILLTEVNTTKPSESDPMEDTNDCITEDEDSKASIQTNDGMNNSSVSHNEVQYFVGDFVYMHPQEKNCDNAIFHIQRLWTNSTGQQMLYGCRYYRPPETYHLPNRKFYEQEIFKTENMSGHPLSEVLGKCVVMSPIDFPKYSIESFSEKDIYVCESRYSSKTRAFKKIKAWPFALPQNVQMTERGEHLEMKKIESVFKDRNHMQGTDMEDDPKNAKKSCHNIVKPSESDSSGNTYYYQYTVPVGQLILGDFVYVRSNFGRAVRHVTRIAASNEGNTFITGVKYVYARDAKIASDRPPYNSELYLTITQETFPASDIISKCCVLYIKDYLTIRHTEIAESDVYVCEKFYDEANQRVCKLQSGILKFSLPNDVTTNEIYHLFKQLPMSKLEASVPHAPKKVIKTESTPRSVGGRRPLTGYSLFSSEIRKTVTARNQGANYGEINRLVSVEWKRLTEAERKAFEDRAHQMNLEHADKASSDSPLPPTPQTSTSIKSTSDLPLPSNPDAVFECLWESCDFMFEDIADLYDHLMADNTGHVQKVAVFECAMRGCPRHKKSSIAPFPSLNRLMRHLREIHISKNNGRILQGLDRSRNFVASSRRSLLTTEGSHGVGNGSTNHNVIPGLSVGRDNQYQITIGAPIEVNGHANSRANKINGQRCLDPMFVTPPPKTQRLLHSEAYIKYIENLDKPFVSNWEGQLASTMENTIVNDTGRLPANWLTNGAGNHGSVINALWALREHMMKDSLGIAKIL